MISAQTHAEIRCVTLKFMQENTEPATMDKVMVIRGFQQLLLDGDPNREECEAKIAGALLRLYGVIKRRRNVELAGTLSTLLAKVDLERLRHATGSGATDHIDTARLLLGKTKVLQPTRDELRHMFGCKSCCRPFFELSEKLRKAERRGMRASQSGQ